MYVVKRDGKQEPVHFDKITSRINKLSYGLNAEFCDPVRHTPHTALPPFGIRNGFEQSIQKSETNPSFFVRD
jgi:hypothetical protein